MAELPPAPEGDADPKALIRRPHRPAPTSSFALGLELATLTAQLAQRIELPETRQGAIVLNVDAESPLAGQIVAQRPDLGDRQPGDPIGRTSRQALEPADRSRPVRHQCRPARQRQDGAAHDTGAVMGPVACAVEKLAADQSLSSSECQVAVGAMLDGEAAEESVAAFLTALSTKGESPDELDGAVQAIRQRMTRWERGPAAGDLLDTCGTGGDRANTVNLSTAAALVVAACGVPVVKHGNRAASSASGSADVLTALGVAIDPAPEILNRCLDELNITFLFAPRFHPGLARVAAIRRQLACRTVFNLVGPALQSCRAGVPAYWRAAR